MKTTRPEGSPFNSGKNHGIYMLVAISDLGIKPEAFIAISKGMLNQVLESLMRSAAFKRRSKKMQSDIISAFKAYIKFRATA